MSFASLALAILIATGLFFGTFLLAYLVDLFTGRGIPPVAFLGTFVVTATSFAGVTLIVRALR